MEGEPKRENLERQEKINNIRAYISEKAPDLSDDFEKVVSENEALLEVFLEAYDIAYNAGKISIE